MHDPSLEKQQHLPSIYVKEVADGLATLAGITGPDAVTLIGLYLIVVQEYDHAKDIIDYCASIHKKPKYSLNERQLQMVEIFNRRSNNGQKVSKKDLA